MHSNDSSEGAEGAAVRSLPDGSPEELITTRYERVALRRRPSAQRPVATLDAPAGPDEQVDLSELDADADDPLAAFGAAALRRIGSVIAGRYELTRMLGVGAAGAVFACRDERGGRPVALKILHGGLRNSDEQVSRFRREARAASCIGHSSIVAVYDIGHDEVHDCYYMVMELLRGEALFYAIADRRLSDGDIREVGRQLLGALAAAHTRGIVHRDVKPENIFLTHDVSGALRIKLLDFGIAKFLRADMTRSFATMDGLLIGTPHYMSPDICTGEPVDEYADLWAATAVLYHAFAGCPPFQGEHIGKLLMKIVREAAPSLRTHRPDLPDHLIVAIDRGLARHREDRFASARELAQALSVGGADVGGLDWDD